MCGCRVRTIQRYLHRPRISVAINQQNTYDTVLRILRNECRAHSCVEATVRQIRQQETVEDVEVLDLNLEDLFKDFVKGQRAAS